MNLNDFVKSRNSIEFVIPAKAGIQLFQKVLDPGFRRGDGSRDFYDFINFDRFVKSRFYPDFVIPTKAGIQLNQAVLGSRLRGSDGFYDFLRDHQF